jgi:hypothetical protein
MYLATLFNIEIRVLPDRSLMEIGENVNAGAQEQQFSKISFENRKNTQSQMVACDSRTLYCQTRPFSKIFASDQH